MAGRRRKKMNGRKKKNGRKEEGRRRFSGRRRKKKNCRKKTEEKNSGWKKKEVEWQKGGGKSMGVKGRN